MHCDCRSILSPLQPAQRTITGPNPLSETLKGSNTLKDSGTVRTSPATGGKENSPARSALIACAPRKGLGLLGSGTAQATVYQAACAAEGAAKSPGSALRRSRFAPGLYDS